MATNASCSLYLPERTVSSSTDAPSISTASVTTSIDTDIRNCSCNRTTIKNEDFQEIINEITISATQTFSYWRWQSSARGDRPKSRAIGVIGVTVSLVIRCLTFWLGSINNLKKKVRKRLWETLSDLDGNLVDTKRNKNILMVNCSNA